MICAKQVYEEAAQYLAKPLAANPRSKQRLTGNQTTKISSVRTSSTFDSRGRLEPANHHGTVQEPSSSSPGWYVSLEMRLDDAFDLETCGEWVEVSHSGALTTGKRGATKRSVVREWMDRLGSGDLVHKERIVLGTLPLKHEMTWENSMDFVANVIRYALVRDQIRTLSKTKSMGQVPC